MWWDGGADCCWSTRISNLRALEEALAHLPSMGVSVCVCERATSVKCDGVWRCGHLWSQWKQALAPLAERERAVGVGEHLVGEGDGGDADLDRDRRDGDLEGADARW